TLFLLDSTPPVEKGDVPQFQVAGGDGIGEARREEGGRAVTFSFDRAAVARQGPASGAVEGDLSTRPVEPDREMSAMTAFLEKADLTAGTVLLALGVALALGAAHALSPGHGKAMVAAYLIGSRGRVRDAILLGGVVTFTHVVSVLIIGLIALVLSKFVVPQKLFPWISAASGVLIVIVGFWLLVRTAGGASHAHHEHAHSHAENHDGHSHSHSHVPSGSVTLGSMISLGVAGGMVPCPTALVVLLVAVTLNRIVLGLAMILVFSAGLASVLILIGVLTVTASRFLRRFSDDRGWVRKLPIASSAVIMIVGLTIILRALVAAGIVSVNL
ncbi:MAG: sulfite exporter TauE/SafE family protein, partial [Phycisphaerae bacterium]